MAYYGVRIGGYHSMDDWGCIMETKEIGYPELRTIKVEVPGKDGYLDLSDALRGRPMYDNRPIKIVLAYKGELSQFGQKVTEIAGLIHGKVRSIAFDDDEQYVYFGRCTVNYTVEGLNICRIAIDVDAQPYKKFKNATASQTETITLGGSGLSYYTRLTLNNLQPEDRVTFEVTAPSLTVSDKAYLVIEAVSKRWHRYRVVLDKENNNFIFNGDAFGPDDSGYVFVQAQFYEKGTNSSSIYVKSTPITLKAYRAVI